MKERGRVSETSLEDSVYLLTQNQGPLKNFISLPPSASHACIICCNRNFTAGQQAYISQT